MPYVMERLYRLHTYWLDNGYATAMYRRMRLFG